ncbi:MAG: diguanylate cyclase [Firmicutes bacterium]|nr:diguanylate cyclase [Bacillota bacterium]
MNKNLATDLKILEKYYDIVRVIDPLATSLSFPAILSNAPDNSQYYHFGSRGQSCKECICLQAIHTKETFVKTEMHEGKLFMITAMPLEMDRRTVALELIKCINKTIVESFLPTTEKNTNIYCSAAKFNDLVFKDALTQIYNRRYIDKQLLVEIVEAQQSNLPLSVVMTDIDYFKTINDQYGHSVGDEVLKCFATQLQNNIRQNSGDWLARYGGEEFLLVLTNCPEQQAYKISEKLRKIIEHTIFNTTAGNLHITASFGVYTSSGQESELYQLVDKVDKNLYQAKQVGRNCTVSDN